MVKNYGSIRVTNCHHRDYLGRWTGFYGEGIRLARSRNDLLYTVWKTRPYPRKTRRYFSSFRRESTGINTVTPGGWTEWTQLLPTFRPLFFSSDTSFFFINSISYWSFVRVQIQARVRAELCRRIGVLQRGRIRQARDWSLPQHVVEETANCHPLEVPGTMWIVSHFVLYFNSKQQICITFFLLKRFFQFCRSSSTITVLSSAIWFKYFRFSFSTAIRTWILPHWEK